MTYSLNAGLEAKVFTAGTGPPLVFLHAAGGVSEQDPVLNLLAQRFSVIAPLAPGFDDISDLSEIADVHDLAIHYDDLFAALDLQDVAVLGYSFGGMVAAELAAHYPDRISKLVLVAPVGLWHDDYPVADIFATPVMELGALMWGDPDGPEAQAMTAGMLAMQDADVETMIAQLVPMMQGFSAVAKFMWPIPDKGLSKRLRRVKADTLVVWGSNDRLVSMRYADDFASAIPSAKVEIVEGAGHSLPLEEGEWLLDLVTGFLS
jgi:pimeloyl-ACP methyl ester carboxylesterase